MDNYISFPLLNPIHLFKRNFDYGDRHHYLDIHQSSFYDKILSFQEKKHFFQPWQTNDLIILQWNSNYGPFTLLLVDEYGNTVVTGSTTQLNNNWFVAPNYAYKGEIDLSTVTEGIYYVKMLIGTTGSQLELISNPLFVRVKHPNTMVLKYSNSINNWDVIFQNNEYFELRVEAILDEFTPQSSDTMFIDEGESIVKLRSEAFYKYKLFIGGKKGIPDKLIENINHIFKCDVIYLDGIQYEKTDGAKLERNGDKFVSTAGWSIEVRPAKNKNSIRFENNIPTDNRVSIAYNLNTSFFGDLVPGNNTVIIIKD